jgi:hypothetical protein
MRGSRTSPTRIRGRCRRLKRATMIPGLVGIAAAAAALTGSAAAEAATTQTFTTPGTTTYIVPPGVASVSITAVGAAGGAWCGNGTGGRGASMSGTVPVIAGEPLTVSVGGVGGSGCGTSTSPGGIGGGGNGGVDAGGGGGASGVSIGGSSPVSELIVAAGGGGGGAGVGGGGGAGDAGAAGAAGPLFTGAQPGTGAFGIGGAGGTGINQVGGGGGGGGGYFGGGGGASSPVSPPAGGGAGGSSFVVGDATGTSGPTVTSSPASVTITPIVGPTASLSAGTLALGSAPAGSIGPEQTVTLTDNGSSPLQVAGVQPGGADPGDYLIADGCIATVAPGASCAIGVRFLRPRDPARGR